MTVEDELRSAYERISALEVKLAERDELIVALQHLLLDLQQRLARNSGNSHLPPSSDGPGAAARGIGGRAKAKPKSGRKRGGQFGRVGVHRHLQDPALVHEFRDLYPFACRGCAEALPRLPDPHARRYQQVDIVEFAPRLSEVRRHEVHCPRCGTRTRAPYDRAQIPGSAFGPRLASIVVLLTGVHHLSRARTSELIAELYGITLSVGTISAIEGRVSRVLEPVHEEVKRVVEVAAIKYADATTWLRDGELRTLWTVSSSQATSYSIVLNGTKEQAAPVFGQGLGILVSDRAAVFGFWAMPQRQVCWAHLLRKFVAFSERDGAAGAVGRELLEYVGLLFKYWRAFKDGSLSRDELAAWMRPLQHHVEALLKSAEAASLTHVSGSCANILAHREALWTFIDTEGVEPTNNHAERELRSLVMWRKRSFGSKSGRGEAFVVRVMSVARTARKQGRAVLAFLDQTLRAALGGGPTPRLIESLPGP